MGRKKKAQKFTELSLDPSKQEVKAVIIESKETPVAPTKKPRKKKEVVPSVQSDGSGAPVKTVAKPVPQLKGKLLPHQIIETLENILTRLDNLENLVEALKK